MKSIMKMKITPTLYTVLFAVLLTTVGFAQEEQTPTLSDDGQTTYKQAKVDETLEQQNNGKQEAEKKRMQVLKERFAKANDAKKAKTINAEVIAAPMALPVVTIEEEITESYQSKEGSNAYTNILTENKEENTSQQNLLKNNAEASKKAKAERELITIAVKERLAKHDKDKAANEEKKRVWEAQKKEKALKMAQLKKLKEEKAKLINQ